MGRTGSAIVAAALVALLAGPAAAMDVATFLDKAEALQRKGPLALLSGDVKLLMGELNGASKALRAERLAAKAAGRTPAYCPPETGRLSSGEILTAFQAIPPAERAGTEVKDALRSLYARRFPCHP
jgi:hypothetical protein